MKFAVVKYNSKMSIIYQIKSQKIIMNRSSIGKAVIKNLAIFTEKHQCCSVLLSKNAGLQFCSLIEKPLQDRCFLVNIAKILRTPVLKNISEPLFEHFAT